MINDYWPHRFPILMRTESGIFSSKQFSKSHYNDHQEFLDYFLIIGERFPQEKFVQHKNHIPGVIKFFS